MYHSHTARRSLLNVSIAVLSIAVATTKSYSIWANVRAISGWQLWNARSSVLRTALLEIDLAAGTLSIWDRYCYLLHKLVHSSSGRFVPYSIAFSSYLALEAEFGDLDLNR